MLGLSALVQPGGRAGASKTTKWASHTLDPPVEKQRRMRSFSVHADSVSELATSSEPVSGGVLSGTIALDSKRNVATMRGTGAPVAMQAPNGAAQTKRRAVWPLKKLGYARVISPDLGIESICPVRAGWALLGHDRLALWWLPPEHA
jgi:hypothetical protein